MNVCLLYRDSDVPGNRPYEDAENIIRLLAELVRKAGEVL